ncbi:MAG TPA: hypothetical protein VMX54_02550 [Vicinamibacteria bacterium]|nr:hypothetical protein [Vicinamibacteria bacterium]
MIQQRAYVGELVDGVLRNIYDTDPEMRDWRRSRPSRAEVEMAAVPAGRAPVVVKRPALAIVDRGLWDRANARFRDRALKDHGGRPPGSGRRYLLTGGWLRCVVCGGPFEAVNGNRYVCARARRTRLCESKLRLPIDETDASVIDALSSPLSPLSPRAIEDLLRGVDESPAEELAAVAADLERVTRERDRLVASIAAGVPAATVAGPIGEREAEIGRLEARARVLRTARPPDRERLRAALEQRTADWREVLKGKPALARQLIRRLVDPLVVAPEEPVAVVDAMRARWETRSRSGALTEGLVSVQPRRSARRSWCQAARPGRPRRRSRWKPGGRPAGTEEMPASWRG